MNAKAPIASRGAEVSGMQSKNKATQANEMGVVIHVLYGLISNGFKSVSSEDQ